MSHPIRVVSGEPVFDRLPVLKLHCGTDVPINDRIFAQAQLGVCDSCFYARLWAFETAPAPDSAMSLQLEGPAGTLCVRVTFAGATTLRLGKADRSDALSAYQLAGEDLQGKYWGTVIMVPLELFCGALGVNSPLHGTVIHGNVQKEVPAQSAAFSEPGEWIFA